MRELLQSRILLKILSTSRLARAQIYVPENNVELALR